MTKIKNYFQILTPILRELSDGDIMYYLQSITSGEEALEVIKEIRDKLVDESEKELTIKMLQENYNTRDELVARFSTLIEKQRGYPLWMGEYSDLEEWASSWADNHWYGFLYLKDQE